MQSILLLIRFEGECLVERRGLQGRWVVKMLILDVDVDKDVDIDVNSWLFWR